MLAVSPDNTVGKRVGLIAQELGIRVLQPGKVAERKTRYAPIEWIRRHAVNSRCGRDVLVERVEILRSRPAAIEVETNAIHQLADAPDISDWNIEAANTGIASHAWERVRDART